MMLLQIRYVASALSFVTPVHNFVHVSQYSSYDRPEAVHEGQIGMNSFPSRCWISCMIRHHQSFADPDF